MTRLGTAQGKHTPGELMRRRAGYLTEDMKFAELLSGSKVQTRCLFETV